jgi:flagellin-like hook-associated protein FlgL
LTAGYVHREADCKHIRRARIEAGSRDLDALDTEIQDALDTLDDHIANLAAQRAELVSLRRDLDHFG